MELKSQIIKRKKKGFSLIELIVVMGIIAVLAIVAVPKYSEYLKSARLNSDYTSAKVIADVAQVYAVDNGGEDFTADLGADDNVLKKYIDKVPEVQSESGVNFEVSYDDGDIEVYYMTKDATPVKVSLYPKVEPEEEGDGGSN